MAIIQLTQRNAPISRLDPNAVQKAGQPFMAGIDVVSAYSERQQRLESATAKSEVALGDARAQREYDSVLSSVQNKYANDPTKAREEFNKSLTEADKTISSGFTTNQSNSLYSQSSSILKQRYQGKLDNWEQVQTASNVYNNMADTISDYGHMSSTAGQSGDFESLLSLYKNSGDVIVAASESLSPENVLKLKEQSDKTILEGYLIGSLQDRPQELLDELMVGNYDQFMDTTEKEEAIKQAKESVKKKEESLILGNLGIEAMSSSMLVEVINDQSKTDYEKTKAIYEQEITGKISGKFSTSLRNVIKSDKTVNAITNTNVMGDIITRTLDLNSISETNPTDYLKGLNNIRNEILQRQAKGQLNLEDVNKLNNQLSTLTNNKTAESTSFIAYNFGKSKETIDSQLPPEYRNKAIRNLFYAVGNKKLSENDYKTQTLSIIDKINEERRSFALKSINTPIEALPDEKSFLKSVNVTEDQMKFTMNKYNLTRQQVIQKLRNK